MFTVSEIKALIKVITTLSNSLPQSIPLGTKEDKIWTAMHTEESKTAHETFNRHFDAVFREDCRDAASHLQYLHKGKLGLGNICTYLSKIDWAEGFPLDIVEIKLQRLIVELQYHQYVVFFYCDVLRLYNTSASGSIPSRPSRHTAPTSKLTDANNTAQPELSFQRKAVQAFHTRRAQFVANLGRDPSPTMVASGSAPPTTSPAPKHNIDMTTSSTSSVTSVEPRDNEDHICLSLFSSQ